MKIKMSTVRWVVFTAVFVLFAVNVFADSNAEVKKIMEYVKWIIGIVASIVTVSAVGFLMWGMHLKNQGDPKGNDMVKNALWTVVVCAVAWALLGALVLKGSEMGTGVKTLSDGWSK